MSKKMNEPVFPVPLCAELEYVGLSLRDYIAAKCVAAMVSTISDEDGYGRAVSIASAQGLTVSQWFSRESYKQADAMLAERAK